VSASRDDGDRLRAIRRRLDAAPVAEAREFLSLDDEDMHRACRLILDLADAIDAVSGLVKTGATCEKCGGTGKLRGTEESSGGTFQDWTLQCPCASRAP
jgi:hypothetical protein